MTPELHEQCRATLQAERAELRHSIEILAVGDAPPRDELEPEEVVDLLNSTLNEIEDALARIANGTFGVCELCRAVISAERLAEVPAARHCFDCAAVETSIIVMSDDVE
jgi:DnaK suppressor protein